MIYTWHSVPSGKQISFIIHIYTQHGVLVPLALMKDQCLWEHCHYGTVLSRSLLITQPYALIIRFKNSPKWVSVMVVYSLLCGTKMKYFLWAATSFYGSCDGLRSYFPYMKIVINTSHKIAHNIQFYCCCVTQVVVQLYLLTHDTLKQCFISNCHLATIISNM